jgi:sodium-dependent dicarboxylate transporter 2/3/5
LGDIDQKNETDFKRWYGLVIAIVAAAAIMFVPLSGLSYAGHTAIALLIFAVIMWATETVPLAVTSLIILFIQPIIGVESFNAAVTGFANPILFLLLGGFIIAEGIRKSGLAQRICHTLLLRLGTSAKMSLFATIFSTGIISAWIENVVACAITMPIAREIVSLMGIKNPEQGKSNFARTMVLGASFGSLCGGFATEIGTAPNLMAVAYTNLPFVTWMIFGFPLAIILMLMIWGMLQVIYRPEVKDIPGGKDAVKAKISALGPMARKEKLALALLLFTICLWVTDSFTGLSSYAIAVIGASLFVFFGIVTWRDIHKHVEWGIIVFFGGALSLGYALLQTGAALWIVNTMMGGLGTSVSPLIITLVFMTLTVVLTQIMSNIALASILVPISVTLAQAQGQPIGLYAVPIALATSLSFVFPMSDPTVAMAYGTGFVRTKEIMKAGIPIAVIGLLITIVIVYFIARPLIG